jgi:type I restriction enzyme R subunit
MKPEESARQTIDTMLLSSGWLVQDVSAMNVHAGRGVAVRELPLGKFGYADYALYVDGKPRGVIEAKREGTILSGIEVQAEKYAHGLSESGLSAVPVPFRYLSTGAETRFANHLDPEPRSRALFGFHRPETLASWLAEPPLDGDAYALGPGPHPPSTLRSRLRHMPPLVARDLWPAQIRAVQRLEESLAHDRPRALIQMATGSGKTFTAITSVYRLIKHAGARRVLFLVDRANLGRQAHKEFQQYVTPDDGRKFTELYNVQLLTSNKIDGVSRVVITTIQRLFSMLRGDPDLDPELEEGSQFATGAGLVSAPVEVGYNAAIPLEFFDFAFIDECHRSIYSVWRQVLDYFDAYLVGLTATPARQTFAFFRQNLVMEYGHAEAVADDVNVDYDVYRIRTRITEGGATVEAGAVETIAKRERATRRVRWERLDEDLTYGATDLDRDVVAQDQIRTVVRTLRDRVRTEIFPGRQHVPKTLIYAKDDNHADDIVQIVREEFGKGDAFCEKITYRTGNVRVVGEDGTVTYKSSGAKAEDLLSSFRNSFNPRIVVTVDMIATGTDIKPLEIVMFLRAVRSRNFFEQMKGRGVRVLSPTELQAATPDAKMKDRFVLIDCVGILDRDEFVDSRPLERKKSVSLEKLLQHVAMGSTDEDVLSSLAGRLARLDRRIEPAERRELAALAGGVPLDGVVQGLLRALDEDRQEEEARRRHRVPDATDPTAAQLDDAARALLGEAAKPIAASPELRRRLVDIQKTLDQVIDDVTRDEVLEAGYSVDARERARTIVTSFEDYLATHRDEITALQLIYERPFKKRPSREEMEALAKQLAAPPRAWTKERLWQAYAALERDRVHGASASRLLTDLVSLVRFGLHREDALVPYRETVEERFERWLAEHESRREAFTPEQRVWLVAIRDHIAANLGIEADDFEYAPFAAKGGLGRAHQLFGGKLTELLDELNRTLAA